MLVLNSFTVTFGIVKSRAVHSLQKVHDNLGKENTFALISSNFLYRKEAACRETVGNLFQRQVIDY